MARAANVQRQSDRRDEILDAAQRCFVRNGFHQTSMQQICAEAGMSPGNLYRYFPSKESLIAGIAERDRAEVAQSFAAADLSHGLFAVLEGMAHHYLAERSDELLAFLLGGILARKVPPRPQLHDIGVGKTGRPPEAPALEAGHRDRNYVPDTRALDRELHIAWPGKTIDRSQCAVDVEFAGNAANVPGGDLPQQPASRSTTWAPGTLDSSARAGASRPMDFWWQWPCSRMRSGPGRSVKAPRPLAHRCST